MNKKVFAQTKVDSIFKHNVSIKVGTYPECTCGKTNDVLSHSCLEATTLWRVENGAVYYHLIY